MKLFMAERSLFLLTPYRLASTCGLAGSLFLVIAMAAVSTIETPVGAVPLSFVTCHLL